MTQNPNMMSGTVATILLPESNLRMILREVRRLKEKWEA
jgi:hypothetical protein